MSRGSWRQRRVPTRFDPRNASESALMLIGIAVAPGPGVAALRGPGRVWGVSDLVLTAASLAGLIILQLVTQATQRAPALSKLPLGAPSQTAVAALTSCDLYQSGSSILSGGSEADVAAELACA
jgi:hypothetical protein